MISQFVHLIFVLFVVKKNQKQKTLLCMLVVVNFPPGVNQGLLYGLR